MSLYEKLRAQLEAPDELRRNRKKTAVMVGYLSDHGEKVLEYLRDREMRESKRWREKWERELT